MSEEFESEQLTNYEKRTFFGGAEESTVIVKKGEKDILPANIKELNAALAVSGGLAATGLLCTIVAVKLGSKGMISAPVILKVYAAGLTEVGIGISTLQLYVTMTAPDTIPSIPELGLNVLNAAFGVLTAKIDPGGEVGTVGRRLAEQVGLSVKKELAWAFESNTFTIVENGASLEGLNVGAKCIEIFENISEFEKEVMGKVSGIIGGNSDSGISLNGKDEKVFQECGKRQMDELGNIEVEGINELVRDCDNNTDISNYKKKIEGVYSQFNEIIYGKDNKDSAKKFDQYLGEITDKQIPVRFGSMIDEK